MGGEAAVADLYLEGEKLYRNENYYRMIWNDNSFNALFHFFLFFGVLVVNVLAVGSSVCFLELLWTDVDLLYSVWRSNYWWVNFPQYKFKNFSNSSLKKDIPGPLQNKMLKNTSLRIHSPCCTWRGTCWEWCTWTLRNLSASTKSWDILKYFKEIHNSWKEKAALEELEVKQVLKILTKG